MFASTRRPSLASPPSSKQAKMAPPSPPALGQPSMPPPAPQASDGQDGAAELSLFDILNIFRARWLLNRDHLIANVLSAQKSETGQFVWVDFQPSFHTHLVQRARALLPPLCPMAKGKKVMFVFILEVLDGDRPQPRPFWEVPKKHRRCPRVLKLKSLALSEVEEVAEEDAMEVVEPTSHANSTPPPPIPPSAPEPRYVPSDKAMAFVSLHPFPQVTDQLGTVSWVCDALMNGIPPEGLPFFAEAAGHTSETLSSFLICHGSLIRSTISERQQSLHVPS
jgi:hypothetical protein